MGMKGQLLSILELKVGRYCMGLLSGPRAMVKAYTERSLQGCRWVASNDENLRATFTVIRGRLEWPQLWLRPWSTLTSVDWAGATASPDYLSAFLSFQGPTRLALHLGQGCWGFQFFCASGLLGFGQNDNGQVPSNREKGVSCQVSPARSLGGWRPLLTKVWGIVVCMARLPGVASQLQSDS